MVVMVPLVGSAPGHRGQQAPVASDPGPVASGRRAFHAHVHADRSQWFSHGPTAATVVALCENTLYFVWSNRNIIFIKI